jgi:hypothetical protein
LILAVHFDGSPPFLSIIKNFIHIHKSAFFFQLLVSMLGAPRGMIRAACLGSNVAIYVAEGHKSSLKFSGILAEIMPQASQLSPVASMKIIGKSPGQLGNCLQTILKPVPIFGWFPITGVGVEFIFHGVILRNFELTPFCLGREVAAPSSPGERKDLSAGGKKSTSRLLTGNGALK